MDTGVRINKYLIVSLIIQIIDLIIMFFIEKILNINTVIPFILQTWDYIFIYLISFCIFVYIVDIVFFYDSKKKYRFLYKNEPFIEYKKYIEGNRIEKSVNSFYDDIYSEVRENHIISSIRNDELIFRDLVIHMFISNPVLSIVIMLVAKAQFKEIVVIEISLLIIAVLLRLVFKNYLKYYMNSIVNEYNKNVIKNKKSGGKS